MIRSAAITIFILFIMTFLIAIPVYSGTWWAAGPTLGLIIWNVVDARLRRSFPPVHRSVWWRLLDGVMNLALFQTLVELTPQQWTMAPTFILALAVLLIWGLLSSDMMTRSTCAMSSSPAHPTGARP